jgi:hypothetical protein
VLFNIALLKVCDVNIVNKLNLFALFLLLKSYSIIVLKRKNTVVKL